MINYVFTRPYWLSILIQLSEEGPIYVVSNARLDMSPYWARVMPFVWRSVS